MQLLAADGCILPSFAFVTIDFVLSLSVSLSGFGSGLNRIGFSPAPALASILP